MVNSGSFLTNGWYSSSKGDNVYLEFAWSVSSVSVATNTTTIYWELRGKRSASGFVNAGGFKVVIDNETVYEKSTDYRIELHNGTVVASGTKNITHNQDGKRSFSAYAHGGIYYYDVNCSGSGSWELTSIPRQATLTAAPDFTDEQNPTITYSNPAGSAVSGLDACISLDGTYAEVEYRPIPTNGSSYTFPLTEAERNVLRNATTTSNSRTVLFVVRTIIGGVPFYSSITRTLSIVNAHPTFPASNVSYSDISSVPNITGNNQHIVQNKSSLRVNFGAAAGNKGAWITGYTLSVNGAVITTQGSGYVDFGAINTNQNTNVIVSAQDSRGNVTTVTKGITIVPYSSPVVNATVARLNNYEDETYLSPKVSISSLNGKNTLSLSYKLKVMNGAYGGAITIANNSTHTTSCNKDNAYVFAVTAVDVFESVTREFVLDKGKFPLFIDTKMNAVGVNAFPEAGEALRVAGGVARFDDGIELFSNGVKEWINPPLALGVEYRTTERYNGKPVYIKAQELDLAPSGSKFIHVYAAISDVVSIYGSVYKRGESSIVPIATYANYIVINMYGNFIWNVTENSVARVIVKFTKK